MGCFRRVHRTGAVATAIQAGVLFPMERHHLRLFVAVPVSAVPRCAEPLQEKRGDAAAAAVAWKRMGQRRSVGDQRKSCFRLADAAQFRMDSTVAERRKMPLPVDRKKERHSWKQPAAERGGALLLSAEPRQRRQRCSRKAEHYWRKTAHWQAVTHWKVCPDSGKRYSRRERMASVPAD